MLGDPVPWASHQGYGRKSFNPRYKEREMFKYYLRDQHGDEDLFSTPIRVDFSFEMAIPKSMPKSLLKIIDSGDKVFHTLRPDRSNFVKFTEDCLTGIVITDDNIICDGRAQKYYSRTPKTIIHIEELNDCYDRNRSSRKID